MAINSTNRQLKQWWQSIPQIDSLNSDGNQSTNRQLKQWWQSIPLIAPKRTITSHINWTHWAQKDHDIWRWKSRSRLETGTTVAGIIDICASLSMFTRLCIFRIQCFPWVISDTSYMTQNICTVKPVHTDISIKQSHVLKCHPFLVLS